MQRDGSRQLEWDCYSFDMVNPQYMEYILGNHHTVSWVGDKARATVIYDGEKAKAMWALMSFIDGVPMLYQGDENPASVGMEGPDLRAFFKEIFVAREKWLGSKYDIEYITTNCPIIAFKRFSGDEAGSCS